jgi:glycosyltransferase involved in cell wall biosynthesis
MNELSATGRTRVLIVSEQFYPGSKTDALLMNQLAEDLVASGRPVTVLTSRLVDSPARLPARQTWRGVEIRRIRSLILPGASTVVKIINRFCLMLAGFFYLPLIGRHRLVLCLSTPPLFPYLGALARRRRPLRFIFLLYDLYPEILAEMGLAKPSSLSYRLLGRLYRTILRRADRVICLGRDVRDYLLEHKGLRADQPVLIPNWADERRLADVATEHRYRRRYGLEDKLLVAYSGNLGLFHEFDTLLDAAALLQASGDSRIALVVVGRGDQKAAVVARAGELGLQNVFFNDFMSEADHYDLLASADLLLVTLKPGVERFSVPSKTYPYLLSGKPVIAVMRREAEIARTLAEEAIGFVIEPGRPQDLVRLLLELAEQPEQLSELGERARAVGRRRFARSVVTRQYDRLLSDLEQEAGWQQAAADAGSGAKAAAAGERDS